MAGTSICGVGRIARTAAKAVAAAAVGLMFAACSQLGTGPAEYASLQAPSPTAKAAAVPTDPNLELQKATDYWGKEFAKNPRDPQTALNYARNLKAMGETRQALTVLQQISMFHPAHRGINGEYGKLALAFDQISAAQKLLEQADDPTNPDWRIISARGTVLAKQGRYRDAIPFYERALTLAPNEASVLNNLALAHAMEGSADKAEPLLKQAAAAGGHEAQVGQNLALVLGLQGKYDEAKLTSGRSLPADNAADNVDYMRRMVKLEPKAMPGATAKESQPKVAAAASERKAKPKAETLAQAKAQAKTKSQPELKGVATDDKGSEPSGWATQVAAAKPAR